MEMYARAGRPLGASVRSMLAQPPSGDARARTRSDSPVPPLSNAHELGDMRSPCSPPCPPPGTCLERLLGGRQLVPRRVQVACTIASMGQAGAGACGLTRTCAVVANCHHRATGGFAPVCRAAAAGRSPASGLIRTAAVVPIWHHRVTWASTGPPTRRCLFLVWRSNRTTMVLPIWQDHTTWADAPGPIKIGGPGADAGEKQTGQVRSRRFGGTVRPARTLRRRSHTHQRTERIFTTSAARSSSRSTRISVPIR
jgi:hypothetical protein